MGKSLILDISKGKDINDEIRLEIAKELGINKYLVDLVSKACWQFQAEEMPYLKPIRRQYLGVFKVKPKRLEHLKFKAGLSKEEIDELRLEYKKKKQERNGTSNN